MEQLALEPGCRQAAIVAVEADVSGSHRFEGREVEAQMEASALDGARDDESAGLRYLDIARDAEVSADDQYLPVATCRSARQGTAAASS